MERKYREDRQYSDSLKNRIFVEYIIEFFEEKDYDGVAQLICEGCECVDPGDLQILLEDYLLVDSIDLEDIETVLDAVEETDYDCEQINFTRIVKNLLENDQLDEAREFCIAYARYIN